MVWGKLQSDLQSPPAKTAEKAENISKEGPIMQSGIWIQVITKNMIVMVATNHYLIL